MSEKKDVGTQEPKPGTKEALQAQLEAMKAENDALKAENEELRTNAEPEKEAVQSAEPEMEEIFIPRGYANDEPNLLVSINGHNYLLPKGKTSRVPAYVAREIRRSWKAQAVADENIDKLLSAAK